MEMDLYHVLNCGVEKRNIFLDTQDYWRFIHGLYEFNDKKPVENLGYRIAQKRKVIDLGGRYTPRERLVDIHGWCLMKNHYHFLLSERVEGGISKFLQKLNAGYAKYFNERYKRSGTLFQGRTKKILIENDGQFNYILHYIHLNPLDYLKGAEEWRIRSKGMIANHKQALEYLQKYRWSSYLDYIGEKNIPSLLTTDFFKEEHGDYRKAVSTYLRESKYSEVASFSLE